MFQKRQVDALPFIPKSYPLPMIGHFPVHRYYAVGGAVQGGTLPLICGGWGSNRNRECYAYDFKTRTWSVSGRMSQALFHMAASVHPYFGLVISGGHDKRGSVRTVEATKDGKEFSILPPMPKPRTGHCQVTVDVSTIMVFGRR